MSFLKKLLTDGPKAAIQLEISKVLKKPIVVKAQDKALGIATIAGSAVSTVINVFGGNLPEAVLSGLTTAGALIYMFRDLIDDGRLNNSVKK